MSTIAQAAHFVAQQLAALSLEEGRRVRVIGIHSIEKSDTDERQMSIYLDVDSAGFVCVYVNAGEVAGLTNDEVLRRLCLAQKFPDAFASAARR